MRGRGIALLLFGVILVFGCRNANKQKPTLTHVQMVPVIYDLMLSEEYATQHGVKDSSMPVADFRNEKYSQVFSLHKIDPQEFSASYQYYMGHPDEMKAIYDSVQSLSIRKRLDIMRHRDKERSRDSIILPAKKKVVHPL